MRLQAIISRALAASAVVAIAALASAPGAAAASPWWHLALGAAPARVQPGVGRDAMQRVTVAATGGSFALFDTKTEEARLLAYNVTPQAMQKSLEELYGEGNVEVTGGVGDATGSKPYEVRFVGALTDVPVPSLFVSPFTLTEQVTKEGKIVEVPTEGRGSGEIDVIKGAPDGTVVVTASNLGNADANGEASPILIADKLAPGLIATAVEGYQGQERLPMECTLTPLQCSFAKPLPPYEALQMVVSVRTASSVGASESNAATVTGGGASTVSAARGVPVGGAVTFGVENNEFAVEEEGGVQDVQAGSHPFQLTTTVVFNQTAEPSRPPALAKDLHFQLPAGLIGNPTPFPQCTDTEFLDSNAGVNKCPNDTAIGVIAATVYDYPDFGPLPRTLTVPVFNLRPERGEPARFGIDVENVPAVFDVAVRTGSDYGVTVSSDDIPQAVAFLSATATFWGVPGSPTHDNERGWSCINDGEYLRRVVTLPPCPSTGESVEPPFLTLPTSCGGTLQAPVEADSWKNPGSYTTYASNAIAGMAGCNQLLSTPTIEVAPDGQAASTPTGLDVHIRVPQVTSEDGSGHAESAVKNISFALPTGVQLSPGAADGLQACTLSQIGFKEANAVTGVQEFGPEPPSCPEASKLATVQIRTPVLANPLEGAIYLAAPQNFAGPLENPFGSLIAMYLVAQDPVSGVLVKLPLRAMTDATTGQVTATQEVPEVPFEEADIHFFGTARAPLSTPALCGTYTTTAVIAPWSGNAPTTASSQFEITTGPNGTGVAGCSSPRPFAPGFVAGGTNLQAGAFTPFTMTLTRPDQDQALSGVEVQLPPGFSGDLANVKLCPEPQAAQGSCGVESLIGHTIVSAGLGGDPYTVTGGNVYLTTGYHGGNFGLSIVNPAQAGPFILQEGHPVIVRAALYVNAKTAAVKVVSDALPTIIDGVPLQIQHVNVVLDREKFAFNPTNCSGLHVTGHISSANGAGEPVQVAAVSSPFQVTNCAILAFAPKLTALVNAKASKKDGASLHVKLTYPAGPDDANIAKVKVDLPIQLPTEQRTLTKACLAKVFETNPASCPKYSVVGHAKARTPILPVPLEGPAYFVSYGSEKFPNLIVALQGYGITIDLVGTTFISKQGVTSSTFNTVPDQPVGSFELTLPQGPYSALAANLPHNKQNFCGTKLEMPTAFVAQNGVEKHLATPITVSGCPKHSTSKHKSTKR